MSAVPHRLFAKQLARATNAAGAVDLTRLGDLVGAAYAEAERDRRRTDRAMGLMAEELAEANGRLEDLVQTLSMQNRRFEAALDNMPMGLAMYDACERLVVANAKLNEVLCLPPDALQVGMSYGQVVATCTAAGHFADASAEDIYSMRRHIFAPGSAYAFEEPRGERIVAVVGQALEGGGCILTFQDMTKRRQAEARIEHMACHDALTGLPNRVLFRQRLEEALARSRRDESFAVLCLDLDRFKAVNDTLGHPVGDALLRAVTDRLRLHVRETDTVARLGGDEFAVIQAGLAQPTDATELSRRLIEVLSAPYMIEGHSLSVGASIGIAMIPGDGADATTLLKNADLALYRAKADGRGTFRFFEPQMDAWMQARRSLELDLREALATGQFELFYQPVMDLASCTVSGFEALIRWRHPTRGLVPPDAFIPLAEEIGLIAPIGEWVLQRACADAVGWPSPLKVAVNLSAVQFGGRGPVPAVAAALVASGIDPARLELEITETVMLDDTAATLETLRALKALGVSIALDDFGTGYSSLSYLRKFPFDRVKIDKSFVADLGQSAESTAIVEAVTGLCEALGMATTVEGVETKAQLQALQAGSCSNVQGYLFSKPRPADEVAGLCQSLGSTRGMSRSLLKLA